MAKARLIRTSILNSRKVAELTWEQEAWWHRLLLVPDDMGLMELDPAVLKVAALGRRASEVPDEVWKDFLKRAQEVELLKEYEPAPPDGIIYAQIINYGQRMPRGNIADFPLPPNMTEAEKAAMLPVTKNPSWKQFKRAIEEELERPMNNREEAQANAHFKKNKGKSWGATWRAEATDLARAWKANAPAPV